MNNIKKAQMQDEEDKYYNVHAKELSQNEYVARCRYEQYMSLDPFPQIEAALLNSADIFKYVAKTGMIYPFYHKKLSGASYEVAIKGEVIWWNKETGKKEHIFLNKEGDYFELQPNSIAFVTLEPMFQIPDYIALRFNLKIAHVYKGLLLGTGPLVDPGFVGKLSIPLHNLTSNTYVFNYNDGIIQMEFTKLSKNKCWNISSSSNKYIEGKYKRKWIEPYRTVEEYIKRALMTEKEGRHSVQSSIPEAIAKMQTQMSESEEKIQDLSETMRAEFRKHKKGVKAELKRSRIITFSSLIGIATLLVTTLVFAITTIHQYRTIDTAGWQEINELRAEYYQTEEEYQKEIEKLNERIIELEKALEFKSEEK